MDSDFQIILESVVGGDLWIDMDISETSWIATELILDVSGADAIVTSTPKDSSTLPSFDISNASIDFRVSVPSVIVISDESLPSTAEHMAQLFDESTQVGKTTGVEMEDSMDGIEWGQDIDIDDIPE